MRDKRSLLALGLFLLATVNPAGAAEERMVLFEKFTNTG